MNKFRRHARYAVDLYRSDCEYYQSLPLSTYTPSSQHTRDIVRAETVLAGYAAMLATLETMESRLCLLVSLSLR